MSALSDDILEVLKHDESDGRDCVEPVDDDLRAQVEAGQCVAIRGKLAVVGRSRRTSRRTAVRAVG